MPLIPEPILDEIQSRIDIAELIGRYVPLQRAGRHFKALCPFHKERTPSFHINTEKQIFHCFGCAAGGNVFGFLMQQERLTFPEAVRKLADEANVSLPDAPQRGPTDQLFEVLDKACRYYERMLVHPRHGQKAAAYLQSRGMNEQAREVFRLGCAPDGWDHMIRAGQQSGCSVELLGEAGLTVQGSRGPIDRFRSRLLFPIQDVRGRVVSFGGRSLDGQEPKYLNGPETPVYHKGRHLFGLSQAKDAIIAAKCAVIVEGYFDCVLLWQAGLQHVVAPLGTALTPEQARQLTRYAGRVVLAFDADAAGEAASLRGIDVLLEAGLHVSVAQLPTGVDPDEFVQASGLAAFERLLNKSLNVVEFLIAAAAKRHDLSRAEGKASAAQSMLATLRKVPDAILRAEYVRGLTDRLQLDERAVRTELQRPGSSFRSKSSAQATAAPMRPATGPERLLAALVIDDPTRWDAVSGSGALDAIEDSALRQLLVAVAELRLTSPNELTPTQVISRLQGEALGPLVAELVQLAQTVSSKDKAFHECLQRVGAQARTQQLGALRERIRLAQQAGQEQEVVQLMAAYQALIKRQPQDVVTPPAEAAHQAGSR